MTLKSGRITTNLSLIAPDFLATISNLFLVKFLNDLTGYRGFTLLPGLHIFYNKIFETSNFLPQNTLEYELGIFAANLILFLSLFLLIKASLKSFFFKQYSDLKWQKFTKCIIAIAGLITINLSLSQARF